MKKGISIVALMATVAVIAILTSTVTLSSEKIITNINEVEFINEIVNVQNALLEKGDNVDEYLDLYTNIPLKDTEFAEQNYLENDSSILYKVNLEKLKLDNCKRGIEKTPDDVYLYSKETKKVFYLKGFKNRYYTLDEEILMKNDVDVHNALPALKNLKFNKTQNSEVEYVLETKVLDDSNFEYDVLVKDKSYNEIIFDKTLKIIKNEVIYLGEYKYEYYKLRGNDFGFKFANTKRNEGDLKIDYDIKHIKKGNDLNIYINLKEELYSNPGENIKITYKYQDEKEEERKLVIDNKIKYDLSKKGQDIEFRFEYENGNIVEAKILGKDKKLEELFVKIRDNKI